MNFFLVFMKEEVDISIYSSADLVGDGDYIVVKIGDPLSIWCISKEKMRGMRIEHVDFDSYDPKHKKINITWQVRIFLIFFLENGIIIYVQINRIAMEN